MRQKYDNPAPLTINLAFDFNLLQSLNDCQDLPKNVTVPIKDNIYNNSHIKQNKLRRKHRSYSHKNFALLSKKYEWDNIKESEKNFNQQEIYLSPTQRMHQDKHQDNKKFNNTQKIQSRSLLNKRPVVNNFQIQEMATKSHSNFPRSQCLLRTDNNLKIYNKYSENKYKGIQPLKKKTFSITKDLQIQKNQTLMVNIRKNLLMSKISDSQQSQIRSVYQTIQKKLIKRQSTPNSGTRLSNINQNNQNNDTYVKYISKIDILQKRNRPTDFNVDYNH